MASRSAQWPSLPRLGTQLAALFLFFFFFLSQLQSSQQAPDIRALEIRSNISYRYARTEIFSKIANPSNESQEVVFRAVLPETAFVSGFAITVNGTVYTSHVAQREEAQREYEEARSAGRTAAHVASSARDASAFRVALNVEARAKVAFNLTYEELLQRERGRYRMRVLLDPGQVVKRLLVEARVHEDADLTLVRVPRLRPAGNEVEVDEDSEDEPGAAVSRPSPRDALVRWQPDAEAQRHWVQAQGQANGQGHGVKGLLELQYDVDRSDHSNVVLLGSDGYFVHFFSPSQGLQPLNKHVVFVLDKSGSMYGRKIEQVQEAMLSILSELREDTDTFSLVLFSSAVYVWTPSTTNSYTYSNDAVATAIAGATPENIRLAQQAINESEAHGATHMYSALETALRLVNLGRESDGPRKEPLVICLTDGEPNGPNGNPTIILRDMTEMYSEAHVPLYNLAFGSHPDFNFLKNLSRHNLGFARRIYEAADTALQLRNFYREVASPLLSNVRFQYPEEQVDNSTVTKSSFPTYLNGSELVVAGRLRAAPSGDTAPDVQGDVVSQVGSDGAPETQRAQSIFTDFTAWGYESEDNSSESAPSLPSLERLWAYLTVRQLLDKQRGDDEEAQEAAQMIAFRYNFVTPLTSLIVVKPDESDEMSNVEAAAAPEVSLQPASYSASNIHATSLLANTPLRFHGRSAVIPDRMEPRGYMPSAEDDPDAPRLATHSLMGPTRPRPRIRRINVEDVQWLAPNSNVFNGSHVFLPLEGETRPVRIADSVNGTDYDNRLCELPNNNRQAAHCRLLPRCPLNVFQNDITSFVPYFCPLDEYVGTCCPDNIYNARTNRRTHRSRMLN